MSATWRRAVHLARGPQRLEAGTRLRARLEPLAINGATWMAVYLCRACGATWASERPFGELQGGGPDAGPECCREPGCTRLRINPGLNCRCHHFEMVMRRTCPFWEREAAR